MLFATFLYVSKIGGFWATKLKGLSRYVINKTKPSKLSINKHSRLKPRKIFK